MPLAIDTINSSPLIMARSPLELSFTKNKYLTTVGGYATCKVRIDSTNFPTSGQGIKFIWEEGVAAFSVSDGPFTSTNFSDLLEYDPPLFCQFVAISMQLHPILSRDFITTYQLFDGTYGYITITARNRGTAYNLTVTNLTTFTVTPTPTVDDVAYPDEQLNLYVDVISNLCYEPKVTRYDDLVAVANADPDSNTVKYTFYEAPALALASMGIDTMIPWNVFFCNSANWCILVFNTFTSNLEGNVLVQDPEDAWETQNMYPGDGQTALNAASFNPQDPNTGYLIFLTTIPSDYLISPDQPIWLTLPLMAWSANYSLTIIVTFSDGSTDNQSFSTMRPIQYASDSGVIVGTWPAGYQQTGFDVRNPGKTPVSMTVTAYYWDGISIQQYSDTNTYYFDPRYAMYSRFIVLQNKYGGYDTLRCRGVNEFDTKYSRTISSTVRTSQTTPDRGTIQMTYNEEQRIWTMRTGWLLSLDELNWIRQLLMAPYAAEVMMSEGLYTPPTGWDLYNGNPSTQVWAAPLQSIIIMQDSVKQYREDDGMWAVEWKMRYADDLYVASDDTAILTPYMDTDIVMNVAASNLSAPTIFVYVDNGAQVYFNGQPGTVWSNAWCFYFPWGEANVNIEIVGYNITYLSVVVTGGDYDVSVTKISSPSITTFELSGFQNCDCNYLLRRLPYLPLVSLELDAEAGTLPIDELLQVMSANYNTFQGVLQYLFLFNNTPGADGLAAKDYLIGNGVLVITY